MNKLAALFHSEVRGEILRLLFGLKPRRMYQAEIKRHTPFASRSIEEELAKMLRLDLVISTKVGNMRFYEANQAHPLYPDLRSIVLKTAGLHDILSAALASSQTSFAFVFGSLANQTENTDSDLDLMIIGSLGRREVVPLLRGVAEQLGREINFHVFSLDEWKMKREKRDPFLTEVASKPKFFVRGTENEFAAMAGERVVDSTQTHT